MRESGQDMFRSGRPPEKESNEGGLRNTGEAYGKPTGIPKEWRPPMSRRRAGVFGAMLAAQAATRIEKLLKNKHEGYEPWELFKPRVRFPGLGAGRRELPGKPELLKLREEAIIEDQKFVILRQPTAPAGIGKIAEDNKLSGIIGSAAKEYGIPADVLGGIIQVESGADPKVKSPNSSAMGIMQFMPGTAKDMGLISPKRIYKEITKFFRHRGKLIKKRETVSEIVTIDNRLDPAKAIPAGARHLKELARLFNGRLDLAVFAYHTGQGAVSEVVRSAAKSAETDLIEKNTEEKLKALSGDSRQKNIKRDKILKEKEKSIADSRAQVDSADVWKLVERYDLSAAKLYFDCSPNYHTLQYKSVLKYMNQDWGPTYYFRIMAAARLIKLYREDKAGFNSAFESAKYKALKESGEPERVPSYRMYAWYGKKDVKFPDRKSMELAEKGTIAQQAWLHPVPKEYAEDFFGYHLRTRPNEGGRIAEKDPEHQESYLYLGRPAAGCLMYLAYEYRRLAGSESAPLDVTTLVRHVGYQGALAAGEMYEEDEDENGSNMMDTEEQVSKRAQEKLDNSRHRSGGNPQAERGQALPLHCTGLAFDIPYWSRNENNLLFILNDMREAGLLDFIREKVPPNFHIMPSRRPEAVKLFEDVYDEGMKGYERYRKMIRSALKAKPKGHS